MKVGFQPYNFNTTKNIKSAKFKKPVTSVLNNDVADFTKKTNVKNKNKFQKALSYIDTFVFLGKMACMLLSIVFLFKMASHKTKK